MTQNRVESGGDKTIDFQSSQSEEIVLLDLKSTRGEEFRTAAYPMVLEIDAVDTPSTAS